MSPRIALLQGLSGVLGYSPFKKAHLIAGGTFQIKEITVLASGLNPNLAPYAKGEEGRQG